MDTEVPTFKFALKDYILLVTNRPTWVNEVTTTLIEYANKSTTLYLV